MVEENQWPSVLTCFVSFPHFLFSKYLFLSFFSSLLSLKLFQAHRDRARLTQFFSIWKQQAQASDSWRNWDPEWTRLQKLSSELQEEGTVVTHRIWWTRNCRVWITVSLDHMYWDIVFLEESSKIWSSSSWERTGDSSENPPCKAGITQCCAPRDSVCSEEVCSSPKQATFQILWEKLPFSYSEGNSLHQSWWHSLIFSLPINLVRFKRQVGGEPTQQPNLTPLFCSLMLSSGISKMDVLKNMQPKPFLAETVLIQFTAFQIHSVHPIWLLFQLSEVSAWL